ncbi:hypothetical protein ES702_06191 [subsurface metagenome]
MAEFNFLENLPLIIFTLAFFVIFVTFLFGGFILLTAVGDIQKIDRGRRILLNSLYALFTTLLIAFVFFSVTYLLQRGDVFRPPEIPGEFPSSPAINFPPSPQFIKIEKYYFTGPWLLKEYDFIEKPAVYAIFCKRNEEYDIIYIGETIGGKKQLLVGYEGYGCWMEKCNHELKNLYLAIFEMPSERYSSGDRKEIKEDLINELNPSCSPSESNNLQ